MKYQILCLLISLLINVTYQQQQPNQEFQLNFRCGLRKKWSGILNWIHQDGRRSQTELNKVCNKYEFIVESDDRPISWEIIHDCVSGPVGKRLRVPPVPGNSFLIELDDNGISR